MRRQWWRRWRRRRASPTRACCPRWGRVGACLVQCACMLLFACRRATSMLADHPALYPLSARAVCVQARERTSGQRPAGGGFVLHRGGAVGRPAAALLGVAVARGVCWGSLKVLRFHAGATRHTAGTMCCRRSCNHRCLVWGQATPVAQLPWAAQLQRAMAAAGVPFDQQQRPGGFIGTPVVGHCLVAHTPITGLIMYLKIAFPPDPAQGTGRGNTTARYRLSLCRRPLLGAPHRLCCPALRPCLLARRPAARAPFHLL
jgi:hypothetical protein